MVYLVQVIVYTALMYLVYILFLRNRPMHGFNRAYLLASVLFPFLLPFIRLQNAASVPLQQVAVKGIQLPEFIVGQQQASALNMVWYGMAIAYIAISLVMLSLSFYQWYKLRQVIRNHPVEQHEKYTLVLDTGYDPGSWYKYIFLPSAEKNETIINHELAHIRLRHTADLILLTLLQVCFWPNIFLLFIRKELVQVHEFQADAAAVTDRETYAKLLLANLFGTCALPATHSFIIHPLKRRIMMLNKKSKKLPRIAALLATGVAITLLMANIIAIQSCNTKKWDADKETNVGHMDSDSNRNAKTWHFFKGTDTTLFAETGKSVDFKAGDVKNMVHKMPAFPGNMTEFMAKTIVYPKPAIDKGVQGRVIVKFIINTDGSIVNTEVVSSPDPFLSVAAVDVVKAMPKWTPGETETGEKVPVQFTLPVMFKL